MRDKLRAGQSLADVVFPAKRDLPVSRR